MAISLANNITDSCVLNMTSSASLPFLSSNKSIKTEENPSLFDINNNSIYTDSWTRESELELKYCELDIKRIENTLTPIDKAMMLTIEKELLKYPNPYFDNPEYKAAKQALEKIQNID